MQNIFAFCSDFTQKIKENKPLYFHFLSGYKECDETDTHIFEPRTIINGVLQVVLKTRMILYPFHDCGNTYKKEF